MTMKHERKAQEKYWNLIQIVDEKRKTAGVNKIKISYFDFTQNPSIGSLDVGVILLERLERDGGIKILERPKLDYMNTAGENNFSIEVLTEFDKVFDREYKQYAMMADDFQADHPIIELSKKQSIIKAKSLELIAREIGELDTYTNLIKFLTECGIEPKLIEYIQDEYPKQSKRQLIYAVLSELATSPNPEDQRILFKIIEEASHPLMHNGDEELAKKYEDKFNRLLGYDGFTLRNYKLKKNNKEAEQDNDLDLYLKKKILVEKWRDDLPHPLKELSFNNNTLEQICYSLWDLFSLEIIFFGANTFPENILIEADPRFHQEIIFNWNLIRELDNSPHKIEDEYGFDIEILNEKRIKEDIEEEINEFIANKVDDETLKKAKDFYSDTKFLETPSYLRGTSHNYYAYKKQKETLLNFIADLYKKFENEILVIKFNEIQDNNINALRMTLALEKEGFFIIKELRNDKKEWKDKDSVYAKIQLIKSKIPVIKEFTSTADKQNQEIKNGTGEELLSSPYKKQQEPLHIVIDGAKKIEDKLEAIATKNEKTTTIKGKKYPQSIYLISASLEPQDAIWLVFEERFEMPKRFAVWNKIGEITAVKKLYDIAYEWDVPNKMINYNERVADNINNGLFKNRWVAKYMKTNKLEKPTLVQKSEKGTLVLKNEIPVKTGLVKNVVPLQYQSLYTDKTK